MPEVQSTYKKRFDRLIEGMIPTGELKNLISKQIQTTGGVGFGKVVAHGSINGTCIVAIAAADKVVGVTARDKSVDPATTDKFQKDSDVLIVQSGTVVVVAAVDVARGDKAYMTVGTGQAGKITNVSSGNLALPGAYFDESADTDELVILRIS